MSTSDPAHVVLADETRVEVRGVVWAAATEMFTFADPAGDSWCRIFYRKRDTEEYRAYGVSQGCLLASATHATAAKGLNYWRAILAGLPDDDPLARQYSKLGFIHPESVLASYLAGAPIEVRELI